MTTTMHAYVTGDGLGIQKKEVPIPALGPGELLVRTRAVSLNNADLSPAGDEHVAGYEFSGEISAVGPDVDGFATGLRVAGTTPGAFAPYVIVHHGHVIVVPDSVSHEEAATLPTALMTEYGALRRAEVGAGDSVLITAATSGIGLIGVQIAKTIGLSPVIATTRSHEKHALLERVGADIVVDSDQADFESVVLAATNGNGVSAVLDHVAGDTLARTVPVTRIDGSVISVGRLSSREATVDLFALAKRQVTLRSVSYGFNPPEVITDLLRGVTRDVLPSVADGRIKAIIDQVFDFENIQAAVDRLRNGHPQGKVVLTVT